MTVYGYARVSTKDQNLDRQLDALAQFPVEESLVFTDHMSGRDFNRPGYKKLCERLKPGDVVVVKSIDRLGRNYDEILEQWRTLTKRKSVDVVVIDMPLLDTRVVDKDVTGVFIADLVLQLLSYVAQVERDNTKQRQAEGIAAARARGVRFGRPPSAFRTISDGCASYGAQARSAPGRPHDASESPGARSRSGPTRRRLRAACIFLWSKRWTFPAVRNRSHAG